jgi:hypothetical protein
VAVAEVAEVVTSPVDDPTTTIPEQPVLHTVHTGKAKAVATVPAVVEVEAASLVGQAGQLIAATTAHILEKTAIV